MIEIKRALLKDAEAITEICEKTLYKFEQITFPVEEIYTVQLDRFPLTPDLVENDFPCWDGGGIPEEIEDIIHSIK